MCCPQQSNVLPTAEQCAAHSRAACCPLQSSVLPTAEQCAAYTRALGLLPAPCCLLPTTRCCPQQCAARSSLLPTAGCCCLLLAACCVLPVACCLLPVDCWLLSAAHRLAIQLRSDASLKRNRELELLRLGRYAVGVGIAEIVRKARPSTDAYVEALLAMLKIATSPKRKHAFKLPSA